MKLFGNVLMVAEGPDESIAAIRRAHAVAAASGGKIWVLAAMEAPPPATAALEHASQGAAEASPTASEVDSGRSRRPSSLVGLGSQLDGLA